MENNKMVATASIRIIGIGGAGCNIVNGMSHEEIPGTKCVVMNTDQQSLCRSNCPNKVQLGHINGIPERRDLELGRQYAQESRDAITDTLNGAQATILVAGLGGCTGTGATTVVAEIAKGLGLFTLCLATTPFLFEGKKRLEAAELGLKALRHATDRIFIFSNEQAMTSMDRTLNYGEAMVRANGELCEAIKLLIQRTQEPGFMDADSESILHTLRDAGFEHFIDIN